ncbi:MAG: hypothetical protein HY686_06180 [Chloroflexi bacterium]|nr:hypothetical protein [Chloroflexota bacterium]
MSSSLEGFPAPASGPGPAQGPDSHFIGRGDFFELYWQFGNIAGTLYVTRGGNPQKPETWLYYLIKQGAATVQSGYGNIPSGDLTGSNLTGLLLKTDTTAAANPGFNRAVGNGGAIDVKVQKILGIPGPSFQQFGNTERVFYNSILRINGQSAYSPGSAQGKAMDSPIGPGSWAIIGMNLHAPIKVQQAP